MDNTPLCLDTNILIAFLKGREPGASALEKAVKSKPCYITSITVYELLFGVARAKRTIGEHDLLKIFSTLSFDEAAAHRAATLHAELIGNNQDIGVKDILIASICLEHQMPLLTDNERHFSRVAGLDVITSSNFL
ncbi:MAG: type II toxin-antitoxin system VapC family toxin [Anaerolineae bacterium]|nr:type II toxin-antitoxin system VapC family toxin [Anaerolineae bacterium]